MNVGSFSQFLPGSRGRHEGTSMRGRACDVGDVDAIGLRRAHEPTRHCVPP